MKSMEEEYQAMMQKHFSGHELSVVEAYDPKKSRGEFVWADPDSFCYHCHIIFRPNTIILYGDIDTWVFRQSSIDLAWLRGAIGSPGYMFSKLTGGHTKRYDREKTKEYALECIEEIRADFVKLVKDEEYEEEEGFDHSDEYMKLKAKLVEAESSFGWVEWNDDRDAIRFFEELGYDCAYECVCYTWEASGFVWPWLALRTFLEALDNKISDEEQG